MNVLFVGDLVGPRAVEWLAERLPRLRAEHDIDLVVVDAENCAPDCEGMTVALVERLLDAGTDVVTAGNHAFDGDEVEAVLGLDRVLRPHNVVDGAPGRGVITVPAGGEDVRVVVLADWLAMDGHIDAEPYAAWAALPAGPTTIVEIHALSVLAKQSLAYAIDGQVAAVLGTHTHEPTIDLHLLPGGTAHVTEVGMTGPRGGPQGMHPQGVVDRARGVVPPAPIRPADGEIVLAAILLDVQDGLTRSLRRL
jgi:calcineurin-like phosphoesterase